MSTPASTTRTATTSRRRWMILAGLAGLHGLTSCLNPRRASSTSDQEPRITWRYECSYPGGIATTPVVTATHVYLATIRDEGLGGARGVVLALDRKRREVSWSFDADGQLLHMISSPAYFQRRLYFGEGMHGNHICHLYCLDAGTGKQRWRYPASGHIESSPLVHQEKVYFGAGDDGLYALEADTGRLCWHHVGEIHIDSKPAADEKRIYTGGGISKRIRNTEVACLDAVTGKVIWRSPTALPVWADPCVVEGDLYLGLGNGRLLSSAEPPETPAGAVVCLNIQTGKERWRFSTPDAVFARPVARGEYLWFTCRDGGCYCLDRRKGTLKWKYSLAGPIVTVPTLDENRLYIVSMDGEVVCVDAEQGQCRWRMDLTKGTQRQARMLSSPVVEHDGNLVRLFFGAEFRPAPAKAVFYAMDARRDERE